MAERESLTPAESSVLLITRVFSGFYNSETVIKKITRLPLNKPFIDLTPILEDEGKSQILTEEVKRVLDSLGEKEREVIDYRFGFIDGKFRSLEQVAREKDRVTELIKQIEDKALRKLRHRPRSDQLRSTINSLLS